MSVSELAWDVKVPGRAGLSFEAARRRGFLTIESQEHGSERIAIPVAVARVLKAKRDACELGCSSRAELLYHLREQCRSCAWTRVSKLVNRREFSVHDLFERLREDGYSEDVSEEALARAQDCGLVDDRRFATSYVRSKLNAGWGPLRIRQELDRHGIRIEDVPGWPEEFLDAGDEDALAYEAVSNRRLPERNAYEKLVRYLCTKGYSLPCAKRVAKRVVEEREEPTPVW